MAVPYLQAHFPTLNAIYWVDFKIAYLGSGYSVPSGTTTDKFVWWRFNNGLPTIESGPVIPDDLTIDDLVLFGNQDGVPINLQQAGVVEGSLIVDGSILSGALSAESVTTEALADGAVTPAKIASGTVLLAWAPNTFYSAGMVVAAPDGSVITRVANGVSGSAFDPVNWNVVVGHSGTLANAAVITAIARNQPGGTAPLDSNGVIPDANLPARLSAASLDVSGKQDIATLDATVANDVTTPGTSIRTALDARYITRRVGESTLAAGTVTVSNTTVTANTKVILSRRTSGGTLGNLTYAVTAGTSFTISSTSSSESSTVSWMLVEP